MNKNCILIILMLTFSLYLPAVEIPFARKAEQILSKPVTHGKGELKQVKGIPVLILQGTPEEMGEQYGHILGEIIKGLERYLLDKVYAGKAREAMARIFVRSLEKNMPDRFRKEIKAAAKKAGVDYETLLLLNALGDFYNMGCSTFTVWDKKSFDSHPIFGRNLDFFSFDIADKLNIIIVYRPEGKHQFAAPTVAGLSSIYSGMNENGLCLGNMLAHNAKNRINPKGVFSGLGFRQILEESSTVTEARALLKKQNYCGGNNLMVVDPRGKPFVAEIDARTVLFRNSKVNYIYATNHFTFKELAARPVSCRRYNTIMNHLEYKSSPLTIEKSKELLKKTAIRSINLQSMIFRPATREIYCALQKTPAVDGPFVHINCTPFFKKE